MKKWLRIVLVIIVLGGCFFIYSSIPQRVQDQSVSGLYPRTQIWRGEILLTGDVTVLRGLTILPGTTVKFAVQDDQQRGYEIPADGYNDLDPTRLLSYGETHVSLTVFGKLKASGTPGKRILFTSAAAEPGIADWEAIYPKRDGSIIEYATIEWSRNGISPGKNQPNSIFRNNILRYAFWGAISSWTSSSQIYNNEIYECGHEGIDVQGGTPIITNNTVYDCHAGIVVLRGSAIVRDNTLKNVGGGLHIGKDATPVLENNTIELAPHDSKKEWRYGDFAYTMFGEPVGTPILTEVYQEKGMPRYAVPAYRIESRNYGVELPIEAEDWLIYGWQNGKWQKIEVEIIANSCNLPSGYSMYVLIPDPIEEEKDVEKFNGAHFDIYEIMAV